MGGSSSWRQGPPPLAFRCGPLDASYRFWVSFYDHFSRCGMVSLAKGEGAEHGGSRGPWRNVRSPTLPLPPPNTIARIFRSTSKCRPSRFRPTGSPQASRIQQHQQPRRRPQPPPLDLPRRRSCSSLTLSRRPLDHLPSRRPLHPWPRPSSLPFRPPENTSRQRRTPRKACKSRRTSRNTTHRLHPLPCLPKPNRPRLTSSRPRGHPRSARSLPSQALGPPRNRNTRASSLLSQGRSSVVRSTPQPPPLPPQLLPLHPKQTSTKKTRRASRHPGQSVSLRRVAV